MCFHWGYELLLRFTSLLGNIRPLCYWAPTEPTTLGKTNTIYRDLLCRAAGATPWQISWHIIFLADVNYDENVPLGSSEIALLINPYIKCLQALTPLKSLNLCLLRDLVLYPNYTALDYILKTVSVGYGRIPSNRPRICASLIYQVKLHVCGRNTFHKRK